MYDIVNTSQPTLPAKKKQILKYMHIYIKSVMLGYKNLIRPALKTSFIALAYLQHGTMAYLNLKKNIIVDLVVLD